MRIFDILSPILLLVLLGVLLARMGFLGAVFMRELNKLTFWILLPAALFRLTAVSGDAGPEVLGIASLVLAATLVVAVAGWLGSTWLKLPANSHGSVSQSAFRANVAYIGLPVLTYAFEGMAGGKQQLSTAVVVMAFLTSIYNVLAVIVLQAARHRISFQSILPGLRAIFTNPILISCVLGLIFNATDRELPLFLDRALRTLGDAAVPSALVCIGGSIAFIKLGRHMAGIGLAVSLKLIAVPAIVFLLGTFFGMNQIEMRIALVFAACPTAAAAFVMAQQMDGDEALTSGAIVMSTIFSAIPLIVVLWLTK
jgi:predicted permease